MDYLYIMDKDGFNIHEYAGSVEIFSTFSIFYCKDGTVLPNFGKTSKYEGDVSWDCVWFKEPKNETQIKDTFRLAYEKDLRYAENRVQSLLQKLERIENSEISKEVERSETYETAKKR